MKNLQYKIRKRNQCLQSIRNFLNKNKYLEVDVPTLVPALIAESYLTPFETELKTNGFSTNAYLTASPEAYLKRLLTKFPKSIYYLGKAYRNNEPFSRLHNHEFTILEWYKVGVDYMRLMNEIEQMIGYIATEMQVNIGVDFSSPWQYITLEEAFKKYVPKKELNNITENFEKLYVQYVEPNLGTKGKPTFVTNFPHYQSPLAKAKAKNSNNLLFKEEAERFELYINGVELINGWTELTNYKKQAANFKSEEEAIRAQGRDVYKIDWGFVEALKKGMPNCSGAAMGVDRLLMVLLGFSDLNEALLFPSKKLFKK
jgi:elongation factor P--(R)-beta-lysine ligase